MKAILPVAGAGTRLRPFTHTLPKVLVHVAGKPILGHIIDALIPIGVEELVLVLGQFGEKVVSYVEENYDIKVSSVVQEDRKGNGHAIFLTRDVVYGDEPCMVIFGDTLFVADLSAMIAQKTTSIAVKTVPDPRSYGIVELDGQFASRLVEKPENPTTNLAIVGIYYFNKTELLFMCLDEIIKREIKVKGEYQLTSALDLMIGYGEKISTFEVTEWLDCGSPDNLLDSNRRLLEGLAVNGHEGHAIIIPPVAIGKGVTLHNSVIGPYVSIADDVSVRDSIVRDGIINSGASVDSVLLSGSIIGENALVTGTFKKLNIGDSSSVTGVN